MSTNLSVSFELICLMGWLLKKDRMALQQLVQKALAGGVSESIAQLQEARPAELSETMAKTVMEFFDYIETMLVQGVPAARTGYVLGANLGPDVKKIDQHAVDPRVLWLAINQTRETLSAVPGVLTDQERSEMFRNELYKNLLKHWNIAAEDVLN